MTLHPDLAPLEWLEGTWQGEGHGQYPTIEPFEYFEILRFESSGRPFLSYTQQTWTLDQPDDPQRCSRSHLLHTETGYWRCPSDERVELIIVQPTGIAEVTEGSLRRERGTVELRALSLAVCTTHSAKPVEALSRVYRFDGEHLQYELSMAAMGHPMGLHLRARLSRVYD